MDKNLKKYSFAALIAVLAIVALVRLAKPSLGYQTLSGYTQGGTYVIKVNVGDMTRREVASLQGEIDALLAAVDRSVSGYNPGSLLSLYNEGLEVEPDSIFTMAYDAARYYWNLTGGVVDCAAGAIFDLWGFGFKSGHMPSDFQADSVRAVCGMKLMPETLDEAIAMQPRIHLNFNAIAQGLTSDLVASLLMEKGCSDFLVNIGGELVTKGSNPSGEAWKIGVDKPIDGNNVSGADLATSIEMPSEYKGIVTSGDYRKFYVENGVKYAHTIDPRSGRPARSNILSATVIAPTSLEADALATFCMVVGKEKAEAFLSERPGIKWYFVTE